MANAKKCDRCGNYYDKNIKNLNHSKVAITDENLYRQKSYDLCDECFAEFYKFISGVKLEDDSEECGFLE